MKKSKFTDSQILAILKAYESGETAMDLARKHGFHHQTLYDWKRRFSGIENATELVRIKELEQENQRLKKLYANLSIEHDALKDVLSKKW